MNPVHQIGRYKLPILSVIAIKQRSGARYWLQSLVLFIGLLILALVRRSPQPAWPDPGYDATLATGQVIHLTPEEKRLLNEAVDQHDLVMQVWGMCKSAGLRE